VKIGLYGGTFDPIHIAHLVIGIKACEYLSLDRFLFMPCATPPHKTGRYVTPAEHRLAMLRLAVEENEKFRVSDLEITRGGTSYTVDTLAILTERYSLIPEDLFLIIGADSLLEIDTWRRTEDILKSCRLVVAGRPDYDMSQSKYVDRLVLLPTPLLEISATAIRRWVGEKKSIKYLVPPAVEEYIRKNELYIFNPHLL
jgi:nicotinate-nucleotide adenylyltransferase